ncbi:hypothetical protein NDU88_003047 [Pleurodeles waltl]|uniref:Uncharacterized protein n=1 Tax=Pleurodeles waltl TaxID=8319 RepID=A0AAV7MQ31_PLEWA|nr:hypothetical protein NDU88_003047 [Pleurodeles waltl]
MVWPIWRGGEKPWTPGGREAQTPVPWLAPACSGDTAAHSRGAAHCESRVERRAAHRRWTRRAGRSSGGYGPTATRGLIIGGPPACHTPRNPPPIWRAAKSTSNRLGSRRWSAKEHCGAANNRTAVRCGGPVLGTAKHKRYGGAGVAGEPKGSNELASLPQRRNAEHRGLEQTAIMIVPHWRWGLAERD